VAAAEIADTATAADAVAGAADRLILHPATR